MKVNATRVTAIALMTWLLTSVACVARQPNVILIITDDQGYGDLGCHGNPVIRTPHLDQLYKQSVRLTDFHVSPLCTPTRAGLMTGQNPVRVGAWGTTWGRSLPRADATTIADVFSQGGYRTGCFGKWHLGDNYPYRPQDRGFQEVLIHGGGGVGQAPDYWGNDYFDDTYFRNGQPEPRQGYCTDVWFDAAWDFIQAADDRPFFVYLTTNAPHAPYLVADKYKGLYADNRECPNAAFYGMITNIDENVGRLIGRLGERALTEETLLIFMTDNGTSAGFSGGKGFNAGMKGTKGSLYDGGHRVPCFFHWPAGGLTGGRDVDLLTAHIDMLPTLAELCGLDIPKGTQVDGVTFASALLEKTESLPERSIVVQYRQSSEPPVKGNATVMSDRWRLVADRELYDIDADPGQKRDLAAEHPEVVQRLRRDYQRWWDEVSERFDEYNYIVVGRDEENPVRLSSFDWHTRTAWSQSQVRTGAAVNSFWAVEVAREGSYEIILRRWPAEVDMPITAAVPGGKAIAATEARLQIADFEGTQPVLDNAKSVCFSVRLKAGKTKLQTWLTDADRDQSRGAYYVSVRRIAD